MNLRHIIISTLALMLCTITSQAQNPSDIEITDLTLEIRDGYINLDMSLDLSEVDIKGTQVVVLTPCISKGSETLALKSIGIYGRNRRVFYQRNEESKPTEKKDDTYKPSDVRNDLVSYSTSAYYANWMDGCKVTIVRTDYGCCGEPAIVSNTEIIDRFPMAPFTPELIYIRPEAKEQKIREISGTAYIDFPVSSIKILTGYRNNMVELAKITDTIDSVKEDDDISIRSITIKGFASPESPYENNTYLARERTAALKKHIQSLYDLEDDIIKTSFEPEDWEGLEKYVMASTLQHKDQILEAIRSDRDPDTKEWIIKSRWKNDYRYLLDNCYPMLRHSDYRIEYSIKEYGSAEEIEKIFKTSPQKLSLEEFYLLAQTYEPGSEEFNELFETAVRMYPHDPGANLNAANSAILRKDYRRALRYIEKAGDLPEATYTRGALEVYMEDYETAKPYLEQARKYGISQAETTLKEIARNRMIYRKTKN